MRRLVFVLATMALAILLAGGVAQAIINGEPDRGIKPTPTLEHMWRRSTGNFSPCARAPSFLPGSSLPQAIARNSRYKEDRPAYVSFDPTYKPGASNL